MTIIWRGASRVYLNKIGRWGHLWCWGPDSIAVNSLAFCSVICILMKDRVGGLVQMETPLVSRSSSWLKKGWVLISASLHTFHDISFSCRWLPQDQTQSPWGAWPGINQNPCLGSNLTSLGEHWGLDDKQWKFGRAQKCVVQNGRMCSGVRLCMRPRRQSFWSVDTLKEHFMLF